MQAWSTVDDEATGGISGRTGGTSVEGSGKAETEGEGEGTALLLPLSVDKIDITTSILILSFTFEGGPTFQTECSRAELEKRAPEVFAFCCTSVHFFLLTRQVLHRTLKGFPCLWTQGTFRASHKTH